MQRRWGWSETWKYRQDTHRHSQCRGEANTTSCIHALHTQTRKNTMWMPANFSKNMQVIYTQMQRQKLCMFTRRHSNNYFNLMTHTHVHTHTHIQLTCHCKSLCSTPLLMTSPAETLATKSLFFFLKAHLFIRPKLIFVNSIFFFHF